MMRPRSRGYQPGENSIECQYTGFRVKRSQVARDYNGVWGRRQSIDQYRHPQEFAPTTLESKVPDVSYPIRRDNFVDVTYIDDP